MHHLRLRRLSAKRGLAGLLTAAAACSGCSSIGDPGTGALKVADIVAIRPNSLLGRTFAQVANLAPGESSQLIAGAYANGSFVGHTEFYDSLNVDQSVTWTSRSPDIAAVNSAGVVSARTTGIATIVVESRGGRSVDSGVVVVQQSMLRLSSIVPGSTMCGLDAVGGVWCWGYATFTTNPPTAASLTGTRFPANATGGGKQYSTLATNNSNACGIASDGITYCWPVRGGYLFNAPVADTSPMAFGADLRFTALRMGGTYLASTCGLTAEGVLYCWGNNSYGQLGDGTQTLRLTPAPVSGGLRFTAFAVGNTSCGSTVDGDSYCWGYMGVDANYKDIVATVPTKVATSERFVEIETGDMYSGAYACGRTSVGAVSCWGSNVFGALGDGTKVDHTSPVRVAGGLLFSSLSLDGGASCGLTTDGRAVCWGLNEYGTLGDGTAALARPSPTLVAGNLRFASLHTADGRTCGQSSGVWYCWGDNQSGNLGVNYMTSVTVPTRLAGLLP